MTFMSNNLKAIVGDNFLQDMHSRVSRITHQNTQNAIKTNMEVEQLRREKEAEEERRMEEEAKRNAALTDANASSLFDESQQQQQQSTNPFPLVDTSFQAQPQFLQAQYTAVPQQFTSFNPYQQQAQQEAMQVCIFGLLLP